MGILNVTPDSFSDGGLYADTAAAIAAGVAMASAGAAILDVGGESTRPGAGAVLTDDEIARVVPVVQALAEMGHCVSVDSRHAAVMAAALAAGAAIVNDVSGLTHDPDALAVCARAGCGVVLMHMRGTPQTMASLAQYGDVVAEVRRALDALHARACAAGIAADRILIDPGIGFAKDAPQNIALLRRLKDVTADPARKMLVGVSRKAFIGALSGEGEARARDPGSVAAALFAAERGAAVLRVHDVRGIVQALRVWAGLRGDAPGGS